MGCLIEFFGEIFIEIFFEGFMYTVEKLMPNKVISERTKKIIKGVSAVVAVVFALAHIIGIAILVEDGPERAVVGWILTASGWVFALIFLALIVIKYVKEKRSK